MNREPTAEGQLVFLGKIQRLFAEGEFTATYKFALLIALAEIAIEVPLLGAASGLEIGVRSIAAKFIELYWQQSFQYVAGRSGTSVGVLIQNRGDQAAVISAINTFRQSRGLAGSSLALARRSPQFSVLVSRVAAIVSAQPLTYLQNFGGNTDEFLYTRGRPGFILLQPGVAYCLRRFQPLIQHLARSHWVEHVKSNKRNTPILGENADLESFLFSASRRTLLLLSEHLRRLFGATCFYCRGPLSETDVDHFVPFSIYPRDLGHNFVLSHPACNRSKSDSLAAYGHLARWLERNDQWGQQISEAAEECGLVHDVAATQAICGWSYQSSRDVQGLAWIAMKRYEPVGPRYLSLFVHK